MVPDGYFDLQKGWKWKEMGKYNFLIFKDFFRRQMFKAKISNYTVRLIKYIKVKYMKIIRKGGERSARRSPSAPRDGASSLTCCLDCQKTKCSRELFENFLNFYIPFELHEILK